MEKKWLVCIFLQIKKDETERQQRKDGENSPREREDKAKSERKKNETGTQERYEVVEEKWMKENSKI